MPHVGVRALRDQRRVLRRIDPHPPRFAHDFPADQGIDQSDRPRDHCPPRQRPKKKQWPKPPLVHVAQGGHQRQGDPQRHHREPDQPRQFSDAFFGNEIGRVAAHAARLLRHAQHASPVRGDDQPDQESRQMSPHHSFPICAAAGFASATVTVPAMMRCTVRRCRTTRRPLWSTPWQMPAIGVWPAPLISTRLPARQS